MARIQTHVCLTLLVTTFSTASLSERIGKLIAESIADALQSILGMYSIPYIVASHTIWFLFQRVCSVTYKKPFVHA